MKIPRIDPGSSQLTTTSPNAPMTQAGTSGQAMQVIGGAIEKSANFLYQKMDEARQYAEKSKADVYRTDFMVKVRLAESQKLNPDGSPITSSDTSALQEELKKGLDGYKANFSSKDGEARGMEDWAKDSIAIETDVRNERYKNIGLVAKANDAVKVRGIEQSFDGSKEAEEAIRDIYKNRLIYNPVEADTETEKALKKGRWNWFTGIVKKDGIDKARDMVTGKEFGFDSDTSDKALSYLSNAKSLEDKNTLIDKIDSRFNLVDAINQGKESIYDLSPQAKMMVDNDEILSAAVSKAQQSKQGYLTETVEAENYVKIFKEASEATDRDALSSLATSMIYRDKNITPDKLGLVLFYAQQRARNLNLSEKVLTLIGPETTKEQMLGLQLDAGVNSISSWARDWNVDIKDHSKMVADFMSRVREGEKPYAVLNDLYKTTNLRLFPDMINYPVEGQLIKDNYNNLSMAYPDGTIKTIGGEKKQKREPEKKKTSTKTGKPTSIKELRKR